MRYGLLVFLVAAAVAGFFDVEQVNEIRLVFAEPNWDEILDSLYAAGEEGRLVGTAFINGVRFDSVGVRYKGFSSYNPSRRKNPFNIKLDYVRPGASIEGHGTLRLANVYKDPSFVREVLSYEIARKYMPAGRSNYANVYVNDTLIGLYTNNEDPDKAFMRTHFYCDENARFKGRVRFDSVAMIGWKYLGPESTPYLAYFELESGTGWPELIGLLDTLSNCNSALDLVLNIDRHLWMLAFDILLVNLDAPINTAQNYYLYRDASARFNPIVWDLNESFGAFRDLQGTGQLSLVQMQQLDPFLRSTDPDYPILSQVFNDARRRRMFIAHMKTMVAEVLENNWYRDRAYEIQAIIDAHVRADPNKFYSYNDFTNNVTRSVGSGPLAIVGLTELMNGRVSFLLRRPEFQAAQPSVSEITTSPNRPAPNTNVRFEARVSGADSVFLWYRQNPALRFTRAVMYDDGEHDDGAANDSLYAVTLRIGAGNLEYYIYAENTEAGVFCPARAEYQTFVLPVTGGVVINELMAENVRTMPDPSGQYDDWIELRNTTARPLSLDGYFLSDDSLNRLKWEFPDSVIPANGHVVVWADSDLTQRGLHANFRLNSSGEMVLLTDPDGFRQDLVVFGPQKPDVSFGRYPDGFGTFRLMNPTFRAPNDSGVGVQESQFSAAPARLTAYPNPFARRTVLSFTVAQPGRVTLRVYDPAGRLVATLVDGNRAPGQHEVSCAFTGQSGGVYFATLESVGANRAEPVETVKLIVAR
ncbi:MAG: CotH kinase family protein [candidate division WOR-3 bacterium]